MRNTLLLAFVLSFFFSSGSLLAQGCECTNCPQFMQDLFVGGFDLNIQGATNPTLGQNGQGVCGVVVHFDHTAICDISITLTSPSGQTVTLVGPIGQYCTSNGNAGTDWNVTFLPCGAGAVPDPGFNAQWNSNQPWGGNNNYSGSYYPFNGCLQNFSGPVNGNWVLTVTDGQANDVGNLYDYEIIFCDPAGISCVSCEANAGALPQPDVTSCQGESVLDLILPPLYTTNEPPASEYSYSYIISGAGGVIQSIGGSTDMTGFTPGNYTVCGLSYLTAHQGLIPNPNGSLTVTQLTNQLNSNTPPFCGNVTSNCVNVTINPIPPDVEETAEVCSPMCYEFLGQFYCQTGDYVVDQVNAAGCHYNGILHLTVNTPSFHTINEFVCPGGCSTHPSFPNTCIPGQYQTKLLNQHGCDSTLILNLNVIAVNAVIQPPATITCNQTSVQLSGTGSTTGVTYLWTASNGGTLSGPTNAITATATTAGTYQLRVCRTVAGVTCCHAALVNVISDVVLPDTAVISGSPVICNQSVQMYSVAPVNSATSYTWTVPAGASVISGQGTTNVSIAWDTILGGDICVTAINSCGPGVPDCLTLTVIDTPSTPIITGSLVACKDSVYLYTASSMPNVSVYNWQITGGSILSGDGTDSLYVQWDSNLDTGRVCVSASNECGFTPSVCVDVIINSLPGMFSLGGIPLVCAGSTTTYTITALNFAEAYVWTVPGDAIIVSGQDSTEIVVNWPSAQEGEVCVYGVSSCGNGPEQCIEVSVFPGPVADAGADSSFCGTNAQLAANASTGVGSWSFVSGPGTAVFADITLFNTDVSVDVAGVYQFKWTEAYGVCVSVDTVQYTFHDVPVTGTITHVCDGTNQNYTVSFSITGGTTPYTVSGGTVTNGVFTSTPIPNGQAYNFTVTDGNNCAAPAISGVFNCNCATNAGQMNQQLLTVCAGDSITVSAAQNTNLDSDDVGAFVLHTGTGSVLGAIFEQNTSGTFSFVNGMTYGSTYYVSYVVGNNMNGLPDLLDPCLSVAPGQPIIFYDYPMANAGQDVSGCLLTLEVSGNVLPGSSLWTVSGTPAGGTATIANPQNAVTNVTASIFGSYTLTYTVTEHGCADSDDVVLNFGASPAAGTVTHVCDAGNQQFTVNFAISGGQAPYTVNGQAVAGNAFVSAPVPSGGTYSFVITDVNGCTSSTISGSFTCSCSTSAGTVSLTPLTLCQSDSTSVQVLGGQNLDSDDVASFIFHTGSGASLGTVLFQNHTGKFGYWATMNFNTTYYISVVAGNNLNGFPDLNDPCLSVSQGQPVMFIQNPIPKAGEDFIVCGLTANMKAVPGMFAGTWTQISGPGTVTISNPQSNTSPVSVPTPGTYQFQWQEVNGMCSAIDQVAGTFLDIPVVADITETCNGTNTAYTLSFTMSNGAGPYHLTGLVGTFNGNTFTSVEIPNDGEYSFTLLDVYGCQSSTVIGTHHCECSTNAGTMLTDPLVFCVDEPAVATWNNDATFDADDDVRFILHDQADGTAGMIFALSDQPSFSFATGLQTGTTYYISAVAGSLIAGALNLSDACLNIAPGTPVQWKAIPFAALSGDATICSGSSTVLTINGTGTYPLELTYDDGTGNPQQITIPDPQPITLSVTPNENTTYTLISITDGTAPACAAELNASITVNVSQPVHSGLAEAPAEFCIGASEIVALDSLITGEDSGGNWIETSAVHSTQGAFNAAAGSFNTDGQKAGIYTFRYTVQATLPCPSQFTSVEVDIRPAPIAEAGDDQVLDCNQDTVILGDAASSSGNNEEYSWQFAGTEVGNTQFLSTGQSGQYILLVRNSFACTSVDSVVVTLNDDIPFAKIVLATDVRCFGESNGSITLDSISSDYPPVMFSLNGGPFQASQTFQQLSPDTYVVTLLDNNGCEWTTAPQIVGEPDLLTVDLGTEIGITFGDSVKLQANTEIELTGLTSLKWTPLFDTAHANTFIQEFLPLTSRLVRLDLVDSNGCKASGTVIVRVDRPEQVYVPNVIKPGSINFNDYLTVYGGRGVAEIESFRVFDRWGDQLFEAGPFAPNDELAGWDATYKGDLVQPGVYVYVTRVRFIDGQVETYKGDVTVIR